MNVTVRVAGDFDVPIIAALRRQWTEEGAEGPIDDDGFDDRFREWWARESPTRSFFVVEVDGEAVGMANVKRYSRMPTPGRPAGEWGYVGNVYVRAEHRDGGVGSVLMGEVVRWSWSEGLDHLRLAPTERSRPFYARLGFDGGHVIQLDPS